MPQRDPFNRTRWRLTGYYAGVMGLILALCGMGYYQITERQRLQALTQKIESSSGILHDSLGAVLLQPGRLNASAEKLLPGLCKAKVQCPEPDRFTKRHVLGLVKQDVYYAQLKDLSGQTVATLGPSVDHIPDNIVLEGWQVFTNRDGERFLQYSLLLETVNHRNWGYLQVGRSLRELDQELVATQQFLLWGWPLAMLLVSGAGWWLAGLSLKPVQNAYQDIQRFTANAAHELRTPLSAAKATVESVLETDNISEDEARKTLGTINRQVNRLTQLVQDLLLLTLIDTQQNRKDDHKTCQLGLIINDVMDEFLALAHNTGLSLSAELDTTQPLIVQGDEEQLYRMIANLVMNAIQYTLRGGDVVIRLNRDKKYALVEVRDTGIGIPAEQQAHVFTRFYRVNRDRNRKTGGSGLGLAIAQAIALKHKGTVHIRSQVGQGSTFIVSLPIATV
ncbi:two-component system sensor histidine kinase RppB [Acaryochloris sp. CCMEE 5410]|uniref:two-component system sensor histidine kinase RppB n=1 Tax=Acaryochloris sp. CCMEE 5410 TaxID=310037 RepID=UPI000248502F|nr:two-component system sensor histidine kinase RppB [Acaryochloris sp. CCMEE 5410]KAI9130095.1 HAMP domain-containing histidine kinase [Acaryochloris sp. CCMEE 5410]